MTSADTLTASLEDYLEAIFHIIAEKHAVKPRDIAKRLKVSYASVTGALRALAEKRMIHYTPYDLITLTETGETAAKDVVRRHEVLKDFFVEVLAVPDADADTAACLMEHSIPKAIVERFIEFVEFVETCPRGGDKWIKGFSYQCDHGGKQESCETCVASCVAEVRKRTKKGDEKAVVSYKLKNMKPGQKCRILKVRGRGETNKRILEMGMTPGSVVELERIAPLGDPIDVKVKGYHLSLRKDEAEGIDVELI
ncbi:MAG: Transcriptional regulator MntR [Syntrophorhabdus sp. PtaU1.Bin058]|nr:MAG: Transcriptional regulator MntR [Syntrophorhabdus sp. PtaU1.Bin058]